MFPKGCGQFATTRCRCQILSTIYYHYSYRFRLVAISCSAGFLFSIDGHTMTVIEVEGNNVQPLEVDSLVLLAGTYNEVDSP
jgi:iron transport multicopper oxidase